MLLLRGELAVGVDLALADLLAGGKQFPVSWHPVRERIASVIAGTGGAEVGCSSVSRRRTPGFPASGRRGPVPGPVSVTGSATSVNRDSEHKTDDGFS